MPETANSSHLRTRPFYHVTGTTITTAPLVSGPLLTCRKKRRMKAQAAAAREPINLAEQ